MPEQIPTNPLRIIIFGATGPNGRELVQQALQQGHIVTAFARNPDAITTKHDRLNVFKGDILDPSSVDSAVQGKEAVLSALGVRKLGKNTILSDGTKNIISAMTQHNVRRFICETSLGIGDSKGQPGWAFNWIIRPLILPNVFADKEVQEQLIMRSNLDWTIVRPAGLTSGAKTGKYKIWIGPKPPGATNHISRADVADFMLKQLTDNTYLRKTPAQSY